jgi:hypothetical protein
MISGGTLPDVWNSVNFGTDPEENLANLRRSQPDKPLFAGEFWDGQGVRWGVSKRMRDAEAIAADFDKTLALGAHVNVYMFHGGTNFGFMNGGLLGGTTIRRATASPPSSAATTSTLSSTRRASPHPNTISSGRS